MTGEWRQVIEEEAQRQGLEVPEPKEQSKGFNPVLVARTLLEEDWHFAKGSGQLYVYQGGRYVPGEFVLQQHLIERLGEKWLPARANAIREWFYAGAAELWEFPPLDRINLRNGILNRETGDLEPHSPDFLSPVQ